MAGLRRFFLGGVNDALNGGPARTGYSGQEAAFGVSAVGPNLRIMPVHLVTAMPVLFVALGGLASIAAGYLRRGPADTFTIVPPGSHLAQPPGR